MKLQRLEQSGRMIPCLLDGAGAARDVSGIVTDFTAENASELASVLSTVAVDSLPVVDSATARLLPPIAQPPNIWCIGLNYSDHAAESGMPVPSEPILFSKGSTTYCGANDPVYWSESMTKLDWEVELGIVIGKGGLNIARKDALSHVLGYTIVNDVSERAWQIERGGQWIKGKSYPHFCPTGPFVASADELGDIAALDLWLNVNGQRMQTGTTAKMIFDPATIISYMSDFCELMPGDLICTGTPPGVALGMKEPRWLKPGDVMEVGIKGLGVQRQIVTPISQRGAK
ncbi:fumarylacetoacetate hydrolase family protein [Gemmobacter sp. 24YEA27]|uniref:fumarylacetoacetate hydrolase family protein n=1 Tax=Gemmobacter sp. 24YEA27 TaxID=3040672 RepID=UPI0024B373B1|nr:fumarylacetoacetate hydrolase family protein [Gemmobacter sp. 24YEA27]